MEPQASRVLILAFGNPGRRDDGLGPALAAALEGLYLPGVRIDVDYQLTVEDAAAIAAQDVVVFVDADCRGAAPFSWQRIQSGASASFSSHSVSPQEVLGLARELFAVMPRAYLLGIRGYEFNEFGEGLSAPAQHNLAAALDFLTPILRDGAFGDDAAPAGPHAGSPAAASCGDLR